VPFLIDENIESNKLEKDAEGAGFSDLVIHENHRSLGWLKINATFPNRTLRRSDGELREREGRQPMKADITSSS